MSDSRWWEAKQEIAAFKAHIQGLPATTPRAYTLSKEAIETLLSQKAGGLDGIRIYVGCKTVNGVMVPTLSIVGTEMVNGVHCDYGVPPVIAAPSANRSGAALNGGGDGEEEEEEPDSLASPDPCPSICGPDNALNSEI